MFEKSAESALLTKTEEFIVVDKPFFSFILTNVFPMQNIVFLDNFIGVFPHDYELSFFTFSVKNFS